MPSAFGDALDGGRCGALCVGWDRDKRQDRVGPGSREDRHRFWRRLALRHVYRHGDRLIALLRRAFWQKPDGTLMSETVKIPETWYVMEDGTVGDPHEIVN